MEKHALAFADEARCLSEAGKGHRHLDDISFSEAVSPPTVILLIMLTAAASIGAVTGVDGSRVFWPYISGWAAATVMSVLIWAAVQTASMARRRENRPLRELGNHLAAKIPLLMVPALIFPIFLGGYTWAKASIPFVVGYRWESFWSSIDSALIGSDGWRIAHAIMPAWTAYGWTFFYAIVWGVALVFVGALITMFASRRQVATFYTALMLSWFVGGFILAYALSAAGPVFAYLADPVLANRFAPLRAELLMTLGPDNLVLKTQRYLAEGIDSKVALRGYGVSAMPSMHVATVTIICLAARGTKWFPLSLMFWALTFFGSVYLGYHYVVDAPVAVAVAWACWAATERLFKYPARRRIDGIALA